MDNKEKIVEALKKVDLKGLVSDEQVFSKATYEMFEKCGLSAEEVEKLERAELQTRVLETLPTDEASMNRIAGALAAISNADGKENAKNLALIAQKDPQMLMNLLALTEVFESEADKV
jgi:hypothetical protein